MKLKPLQKYFFFLILTVSSCRENATINRPDVSDVDVNIQIERFDRAFASTKLNDIPAQHKLYEGQYGGFYKNYIEDMLQIGSLADSNLVYENLVSIIRQKDFVDLNKAVNRVYPDMNKYNDELSNAFQYIKYYFPQYNIPRFISYVSGFAYQTPIGENYVGIGLDMFLGADSEFYPALVKSIPMYISRRFTPENITPRVVEAVLREDLYSIPDSMHTALQHMVYSGKILYAMDLMLENVADELKIGYSKEQLSWAKKYESDVWKWFLQEGLLYNTDLNRIQKYFIDAPFTPELGENNESAPKLGSYIGWMMVRKYMDRNPEINLNELLKNTDAQQILEESKYKGK
ncbi:gliding motility lipoprotein GldB [Sphingobacterium bovistauri]|uniref:Gliding motility lipoprotein GldB n=1 Tax=Sphingobacterium bovistauri TaxID=2781959 RepID=A0ABS7Z131_9SPHI|nr:gliding motility lipoprotein GldB [Sphingobacterium bovistauri]MCA5003875.1 gliding motility lipoprotein GldB [Sphingobacterium bovistauri]